jgi:hypothetical protein
MTMRGPTSRMITSKTGGDCRLPDSQLPKEQGTVSRRASHSAEGISMFL